ncbi:hypothetical protein, partial [Pseudomonas aeruginosa]|uniref:hypothetical protein n=1 Tax=Pseudomonas aeruginosa TaxID=287 RepID=UPI0040629B88
HQSDRRLCLAAEPQAGGREVSAAKAARKTLAYDFFRFLYSPLLCFAGIGWKTATSPMALRFAGGGDSVSRSRMGFIGLYSRL